MLEQTFDAFKTYDWGVDPQVLKPLQDAIIASHGDDAARKDLETRLIAVFKTDVPQAAKDAVCRMLRTIGTSLSVPVLAGLLPDEKLSHMARYALERIPAPEAAQALLHALPSVPAKLKVGIISSLGTRREAAAIAPLQGLLADGDSAVARAAAHALGTIGTLDAARPLVSATPGAATKAAIADASMACAENLLAVGNKAAAKAAYAKVLASSPSKPVAFAANHGMKVCGGT